MLSSSYDSRDDPPVGLRDQELRFTAASCQGNSCDNVTLISPSGGGLRYRNFQGNTF